jgi:hypothetical protein
MMKLLLQKKSKKNKNWGGKTIYAKTRSNVTCNNNPVSWRVSTYDCLRRGLYFLCVCVCFLYVYDSGDG